MRKRKAFEDNIRKNRSSVANWLKYAAWEEQQQTLRKSVYSVCSADNFFLQANENLKYFYDFFFASKNNVD